MKVRVLREACCAQDDQVGPLDANFEVPADGGFGDLVAQIQKSRFLQYSASHVILQGEVAGAPVVKIFSPYYANNKPAEFYASAGQTVSSVLGANALEFRFVFE